MTARIVLLAAAFAAVRFAPLYEQFLGQVMLLTQRSPQTLAGALRSSQAAPLYALQLAVFRAVILPWSRPALTVADTLVFGTVLGLLLAWAGNAAADSACFALSRLLFGRAAARRLPETARALVLGWGGAATCAALLILPWAGGFAGYHGAEPSPMVALADRRRLRRAFQHAGIRHRRLPLCSSDTIPAAVWHEGPGRAAASLHTRTPTVSQESP